MAQLGYQDRSYLIAATGFARWRIVGATLGALDLANGTLTVPESSQTD